MLVTVSCWFGRVVIYIYTYTNYIVRRIDQYTMEDIIFDFPAAAVYVLQVPERQAGRLKGLEGLCTSCLRCRCVHTLEDLSGKGW